MANYHNLLVVLDPTHESQPALERAAYVARRNGAKLSVFVTIYDFSYEMTTMLSKDEREAMRRGVIGQREAWVEDLIAPLRKEGLNVETKVVWYNRPFESIIQEVINGGHDAVIKGTHKHAKFKSVIFTPTDWHLLRKCPVPLLLVKEGSWPANGRILAAINCGTEDESHQVLNDTIIRQAKDLADMIQAQVHLVNAYPGTPVNIAIELPEFDPEAYNASMQKHHQEMVAHKGSQFHIPDAQRHVLEGLPEDVIPAVAEDIDAELVILGTVGRTGISAALIGNTAEHVIDRLDCDLLAIKPEGFVSPLHG